MRGRTPYPELMTGLQIVEVPWMPDDTAHIGTDYGLDGLRAPSLLVGTKPPDELGQLRREARLLVRRGLADVLEWLGQPVVNEPVLAVLKTQTRQK